MARIKKQGLDYFPLDTDFMQQRAVRRLMKQQGDRAFTVLLCALSAIYGGEGYYVRADRLFCEDLAADLYDTDVRQVEDILGTAVAYGLFDEHLYREYGILTSVHIQEQYLFCAKRRKNRELAARYRLVDTEPAEAPAPPQAPEATADKEKTAEAPARNDASNATNVTLMHKNVTLIPQSTAKQSIAQQSTEKPLLDGSPDNGGTPDAGRTPPPKEDVPHDDAYWTERIARLRPPTDGQKRNYGNLRMELERWRIPPQEQYTLILKSGFGVIGHPVWKGISEIVQRPGIIRQPGKFLLSKCR